MYVCGGREGALSAHKRTLYLIAIWDPSSDRPTTNPPKRPRKREGGERGTPFYPRTCIIRRQSSYAQPRWYNTHDPKWDGEGKASAVGGGGRRRNSCCAVIMRNRQCCSACTLFVRDISPTWANPRLISPSGRSAPTRRLRKGKISNRHLDLFSILKLGRRRRRRRRRRLRRPHDVIAPLPLPTNSGCQKGELRQDSPREHENFFERNIFSHLSRTKREHPAAYIPRQVRASADISPLSVRGNAISREGEGEGG